MVIYKTKISIAHIQCLLRIDGCILPCVFLTSSCVVPESSGFQSNAASSSPFVHVAESTVHSFFQRLAYYRRQPQTLAVVQLHRLPTLWCQTNLDYSYSPSLCYCDGVLLCDLVVTVYGEFFNEPKIVAHTKRAGDL